MYAYIFNKNTYENYLLPNFSEVMSLQILFN